MTMMLVECLLLDRRIRFLVRRVCNSGEAGGGGLEGWLFCRFLEILLGSLGVLVVAFCFCFGVAPVPDEALSESVGC